VARTAGCGVWHENSSANIYGYQGDVIGARKLFYFKVKEGSTTKKSNLIMHEFSLFGEQEENFNWVLCIVQKKGSESTSGAKGAMKMDPSRERGFAVILFNTMGFKQNVERPKLIWKPI
jgi:hypothetical protein